MKDEWLPLRPQVLRRIKPSAAFTKRARTAANRLSRTAIKAAKALGADVEPVLVGSLAKDTHTMPSPDIDLFVLFPPTTPREELERIGLALGKKILARPSQRYAEHPYVQGRSAGFRFDVVPAYKIADAEAKMSAVDRSPFHTDYVQKHLRARQRDEVRLLKQFLKGIGCYGAETATGGFSGYLAELLVLRFGGFWETLMGMRELRAPIAFSLDAKSAQATGGDLAFTDPVDPRRNAAAAVGRERLETFLRAARAFTAMPSLQFFFPPRRRAETQEALLHHLSHRGVAGLMVPPPIVRAEARIPHLRRLAEKFVRELEGEGFRVVRHVVEKVPGGFLCLWEHEPVVLPDSYEHLGPPVDDAGNSRKFLQKWQGNPEALTLPHPRDGRWSVSVRRPAREPIAILAPRLTELLKGTDLPKGGARKVTLRRGVEWALRPGTRMALTKVLVPRDPWEDED